EGLRRGAGGRHLVGALERHAERLPHPELVVHDQHAPSRALPRLHRTSSAPAHARAPSAVGSRITTLVASPASGTTASVPPLRSRTARARRKASGRSVGSP